MNKNDLVLTDQGFNIVDLCSEAGCSVLIPLLKGRAKLTKPEVTETRDIAAAQIHVKKFNGILQRATYRIQCCLLPDKLVNFNQITREEDPTITRNKHLFITKYQLFVFHLNHLPPYSVVYPNKYHMRTNIT